MSNKSRVQVARSKVIEALDMVADNMPPTMYRELLEELATDMEARLDCLSEELEDDE